MVRTPSMTGEGKGSQWRECTIVTAHSNDTFDIREPLSGREAAGVPRSKLMRPEVAQGWDAPPESWAARAFEPSDLSDVAAVWPVRGWRPDSGSDEVRAFI